MVFVAGGMTVMMLEAGCVWMLPVFFFHVTTAQTIPGVRLQADGIPTNESVLTWVGLQVPDIPHFSFCAYLQFQRAMSIYDTLLSYAVPGSYNELYIGFDIQSVVVEVEKYSLTTGKGSYTLLRWWRFCYIHSFETKQHTLYWNDEVFSGTSEGPDMVRGGGLLVIGQDQDSMGGGYTFSQSLNAVVGDLRLYNRTLTNSEALDFVSCKETHLDPQPLVSFSDFKNNWKIEGSINIENLNLADICQKEPSFLIMFPEAWSFSQAVAMCNNVGGSLPVPISARENENILSFLNPYIPYCSDAHGYSIALGMLKEYETHSHHHYKTGENITYSNFLYRRDEDSNCVAIAVTEDDYGYWYYSKCDLELCTICNFTSVTHLKVRGLCDESLFDRTYLVLGQSGEKPVFRGFSNSQLQWTGTTWTLTYLPENNVKATMTTNFEDEYPVGLRQWTTEGDRCSLQQGSSQFLVISACQDGQYTCDDGTCISIDHRCDLLAHCPDLSDEINCNTVKLSETYIWELPPPLPDGSPTPVSVLVNITSVRDVSLIDLSISFDMILMFTWRDPRLTFQHLRDNMDQNPVREGVGVWHPEVFMEDGDGSSVDVQVRGRQTFVRRVGPPNPDIPTRLKEDQQFEGSKNDMVEIRPLTVQSICQFDLTMYPFDVQECRVLIRSTLSTSRLTLLNEGIHFLSGRRLLEYYVKESKTVEGEKGGKTHVTVIFTFSNLSTYYISGTYVPTTLLLTITYLTFYFALDDFTDRIMVSLTALMVMAALFLQTNQSMPRTAYLKVVDIWFLFCIIMKFVIVLWLVVINYVRQMEAERSRKQQQQQQQVPTHNGKVWTNIKGSLDSAVTIKTSVITANKINFWAQLIIPTGFFAFVLYYLIYTVTYRTS